MPFIYPTSYEVRMLEPTLVARSRAERLGLQILPVRNTNRAKVRWRQRDNYWGLQHLRGLDGAPTLVTRVGEKLYEYSPGVFGEYIDITETELTERAESIDVRTQPIDVSDLVADADEQLIQREDDRLETSAWALLVTGTITIKIAGPNGTQVGYTSTFPIQTYTATILWSTYATAVPLKDFFNVSQLGIGKGAQFNEAATAYMNSLTFNDLMSNTNQADLAGRRVEAGNTIDTLPAVNNLLVARGSPRIQIYDAVYQSDSAGTITKMIPDRKVVVVGKLPGGAKVGYYVMTRNASNNYQPGSYRYVIDRANGGGSGNAEKRTPANIEVHRGHNGGPTIEYPSAVVVMNV